MIPRPGRTLPTLTGVTGLGFCCFATTGLGARTAAFATALAALAIVAAVVGFAAAVLAAVPAADLALGLGGMGPPIRARERASPENRAPSIAATLSVAMRFANLLRDGTVAARFDGAPERDGSGIKVGIRFISFSRCGRDGGLLKAIAEPGKQPGIPVAALGHVAGQRLSQFDEGADAASHIRAHAESGRCRGV